MNTYLIHEKPNPTSDFYFPNRNCDFDILLCQDPSNFSFKASDTLIFVRYINLKWRIFITRLNRINRPNIILFIDDDLFDRSAHGGLPWRYQWKLYTKSTRHQRWFKSIEARLWVSSAWLQQKYQSWSPTLKLPQNPYEYTNIALPLVFYHGSASHQTELHWLLPVIEKVLSHNANINFEIIGGIEIRKLFLHLPQVHVVHPMSWSSYKSFISRTGRLIGLAPLVNTSFNNARSETKFFDITKAGAVGIYADSDIYNKKVQHLKNGLLLPMETECWVKQLLWLVDNPELCKSMWKNAKLAL